ncbi:MAG: DNA polymerase/3'-5' exonuclease PolX [Candidatus Omnitrophica bacterium]|nr:DNA polymerase/3'-5' exonuclease PolX [Candidatus Omnitrophota bacterium]
MKQLPIADTFERIADLLELKGANPFRIRAYRRAALNLRSLTEPIEAVAQRGALREIPGIGEDLALKAQEIIETGRLQYLDELTRKIPPGLADLLSIAGVGPKTAKLLYDRFRVKSVAQLANLVKAGKLRTLPGFREKKEENILRGIRLLKTGQGQMPLAEALALSEEVLKRLKGCREIERICVAGSLRRRKETIRDLDLLIASTHPARVMEWFVKLPLAAQIQARGLTKSSIRTAQGVQVDLRVVEPDSYGAALVYFTGSKEHNIAIRGLANRMGLTVNEYGVFKIKGGRKVAGREEEDVYRALGLAWIPPELREDAGETDAARNGKLPKLVERKDLKGDFHIHSDWSDGHHPIEEVARAARARGHQYMVLSDHSRSLRIAGGLSVPELFKEREEVRRLNKRLAPFRILMGAEVDILPDGRLDYPDEVLQKLDCVIAAVHSSFRQSKAVMTRRVIRALRSPYVSILAHPTTRLRGVRDPVEWDFEEVIRAACQGPTALEINCASQRMDLNDLEARRAQEAGAMLVLSTDTHSLDQLQGIETGLSIARRAWVSKRVLLNTLEPGPLMAWIAGKRRRNAAPG